MLRQTGSCGLTGRWGVGRRSRVLCVPELVRDFALTGLASELRPHATSHRALTT